MTVEVQAPETPVDELENQEHVIREYVTCGNCHSQVILFSRTIKTFCYRCGLPVTEPDEAGLYYRVIEAGNKISSTNAD